MLRIDVFPTHQQNGIKFRRGRALPFGSTIVPEGINFSVFSRYATSCDLVLFNKKEKEPFAIIPFPKEFRIGNVFAMTVFDLDFEDIEYGYRVDGPYDPAEGHLYNKERILMDPYAKAAGGREIWGIEPDWNNPFQHRSRIFFDDFEWEGEKPLELEMEDLIIYELHVRSYTKHQTSKVKHPGTYAAIIEKIPYLKELGINCIELLPIYEFDEFENSKISKENGEKLMNYWGYSTVGFFAPKAGYAATGKFGMEVDELKNLIKELHKNGIEIILDVVFNHTAEGNEDGPYISFKGHDNKTYYLLTPEGHYYNFSGCGNTLNCNNPIVRNMILDCLRYWASEYHIDGFRFDLASILSRDQEGAPMANPPLLETLAFDPILGKCKLIAEAWDAGGLYQVGSFPSWGRWAEWNGKFRDDIRKFLKGDKRAVKKVIERIQGSPDLYGWENRGTTASINFITCHDGFTMMDLVSYNEKHNIANGEDNCDGTDDNESWNCGWEGPTDDPDINFLRKKQIKNAIILLLVSRGIPMILSGDEFGNTQFGNNNAYCQDNEISWLNWDLVKENNDLFSYFKNIIAFRKAYPVLRVTRFDSYHTDAGYPEISWHGTKAWNFNYDSLSYTVGVMFFGSAEKYGTEDDEFIYMAMNSHWKTHGFELPVLPGEKSWYVAVNTDMPSGEDFWPQGKEQKLKNQKKILVGSRSVIVLISKKNNN
ncbi:MULTISPECIES: glycogen debranching protein GlgX [Psychrilyobacter]|uniref:Glycogen debranching enzyme GlgX n=1 Tax=Psychrilyobacter piezotolerans TaxID=2293438 RepID=A0ABX9KHI0_9FUSO|nr:MULTISPECIES: glycogen debranching protein GlgX [Psychrilyobacter]MCS5421213.1 glycogen debranching protein GlgX [Psychrilyobacter sp. S5]NDI77596.1 glycogen debranching protein GlgX [Psychrilyobacter piezotolerans]RDE62607.1 glycogen debranching enzyme GlgX [Psychrilyobacter sp. S5]REI41537.1 glycogen debranching enzyme GlgX [Psychrilyobacter piezotolerans]